TVHDRKAIEEMYGPLALSRTEGPEVTWARKIVDEINKAEDCNVWLDYVARKADADGRLDISLGYPIGSEGNQSWYELSVFEFFDEETNADMARTVLELEGACGRS